MSLKLACGLVGLILVGLIVTANPWLPLPDPEQIDVAVPNSPPDATYLLGTDPLGRDYLGRLFQATRWSFLVGGLGAAAGIGAGWLISLLGHALPRWFSGFVAVLAHIVVVAPAFLLATKWSSRLLMLLCVGSLPIYWLQFLAFLLTGFYGEALPILWGLLLSPAVAHALLRRKGTGRPWSAGSVLDLGVLATSLFAWSIAAQIRWDVIGLGVMPLEASWGTLVDLRFALLAPPPALLALIATALLVFASAFLVGDGLTALARRSAPADEPAPST